MDVSRLSALTNAITAIAQGITLKSSLQRLVQSAVVLTDCEYGALGTLGSDGALEEFFYEGISDESADEISHFPEGKGMLGHLLRHPQPMRLTRISDHPASIGFPANHPTMNGFLGVPIKIRNEVYGSIYLTQKRNGKDFTQEDESNITLLAAAAGIAIDSYRGQVARTQVGLMAERERIARDLHDLVIQRLFATGLSLKTLESEIALSVPGVHKVREAIDGLDQTIQQIRSTIFNLKLDQPLAPITDQLRKEVARLGTLAGFDIIFSTEGDVDLQVDSELTDHVFAVVRELITNSIKHADATQIDVHVLTNQTYCEIRVLDNGVGFVSGPRRSGLLNLEERAHSRGGEFEIRTHQMGGTSAIWRASL